MNFMKCFDNFLALKNSVKGSQILRVLDEDESTIMYSHESEVVLRGESGPLWQFLSQDQKEGINFNEPWNSKGFVIVELERSDVSYQLPIDMNKFHKYLALAQNPEHLKKVQKSQKVIL